MGHR